MKQQATTTSKANLSARPLAYVFAKNRGVLLQHGEQMLLKYAQTPSLQTLMELRRCYGDGLQFKQVSQQEFTRELTSYYESSNNNASEVMDDLGETFDLSEVASELAQPEDLLESQDDAPIIRLINAVLTEAIKSGASDIHIETFEQKLIIRMRVDGVLRQVLAPPRSIAGLVVSRIKVMADLDISERRIPQDGRISLKLAGRAIDVRVSTLPSGYGERVVMRILDKQSGRLNIEQIGMQPQVLDIFKQLIQRPHGILLVTGPTGSGKTTTLYSAISHLNNTKRNILTIEDPIEYYIEGIGQSQVNSKVDMTFARGLRAILRQDPDVVMVGEIRDLETAEIAVQASLTGHLVLSTLHTNTAVGAMTRLRDMGVEPFLLSSSLIGVLAQRLVRVLCSCKQRQLATAAETKLLKLKQTQHICLANGCEKCQFSGYSGRRGIYELIEIDDEIRAMIHNGDSERAIETAARKNTPAIFADGKELVLKGETSIDELLRVTQED